VPQFNKDRGNVHQLPLNEPSPLTAFKKPLNSSGQTAMAAASPTLKNFMPSVRSTENLEKHLQAFKMNGVVDEILEDYEESFDVLAGDSQANLELSRMQEKLSAGYVPSSNADRDVNGADGKLQNDLNSKSVSFHPETTIYKQVEATEEVSDASTVKREDTVPYMPSSIDSASPYSNELQVRLNGQYDATFVSNRSINASVNTSGATALSMPSLLSLEKTFEEAEEWKMTNEQFEKDQEEKRKISSL
jgi:hypothetical protein